jgi:PASTA domain
MRPPPCGKHLTQRRGEPPRCPNGFRLRRLVWAMGDVDSTSPQPGGRRPDWLSKVVIPVLVAVLGAILVTALTPLGDSLRELFFPTKVDIKGRVAVENVPAAGARIALGDDVTRANDAGEFVLRDVGTGRHTLTIKSLNSKVQPVPVKVEEGDSDLDLHTIQLPPLSRLGVDGLSGTAGPGGFTYDVRLWIDANSSFLRRIQSVQYTLQSPFPSEPVVPTSGAEEAFCLHENKTFQSPSVERPFPTAKVDLGNGQTFALVAVLGLTAPAGCSTGSSTGVASPPPGKPPPPPPRPPPPPPPPPSSSNMQVPDVRTQLFDNAAGQLQGAGFAVARRDVDSSQPKDTVIDQEPRGGSLLARGRTVTLFVSKGPKQATIPDVTSQDRASARQMLKQSGFSVDVQEQDTTDPAQDGIVLSQDPPGGTKAKPGTSVKIVVGRLVSP